MAVGEGSLISPLSYIGIGRETTFGTYVTGTAGINFISASLKTVKETKILEEVTTDRVFENRISMGRVIEGDMEFYVDPKNLAFNYILENAFGSAPTTATATGETTGGTPANAHTFQIGNVLDASYTSLSINHRKGQSTTAKLFGYVGMRVNELSLIAELDEGLKCNVSMIGQDSTTTVNDVSASLTTTQTDILNFVQGRFSVETSFASLTTSSFWHVQSMEFSVSNNLKGDTDSRRIGSDVIGVLPPGAANITLNCTIRFDTTTAYDAMIAATKLSAEFEFVGDTFSSGSVIQESLKFSFPEVYVTDAGDPEIGGPDEMLKSEVSFAVIRDNSSATGYAVQAEVVNQSTMT